MNDSENAKRLFFEALALMDSSDFGGAEQRFREALQISPNNSAILTNLAVVLLQSGKRPDALAFAEQAIAISSDNVEALLVVADCQMSDENGAGALATYDKIIALDPALAPVHNNRGIVLQSLDRHAEALVSYDRAIAIEPQFSSAHVNRGNALRQLKRSEEAVAAYDRALVLEPGRPQAWLDRGNALHDLGRHEDALAAYDRALGFDSELAHSWLGRGNILSVLRRYGEAVDAYRKALAHSPDLAEAWLGLGNTLQCLKCHDDALDAFAKALACRADFAGAWFGRGNVLYERKRYQEALAAYDKSLDLDREFANAWIGRGDALRVLGRASAAIEAYRQALTRGGDAGTIEYCLASLGAQPAPAVPPGRFITSLFDSYADNFDHDLVVSLNYQAPALLADALRRYSSTNAQDILDLGCGTGLVGAQVLPFKRTLAGVDLSKNMLEKARQRGIYDRLVCSDVIAFLQNDDDRFDLVLAADVFIYLGDLSSVFGGVRRVLRGGGLFCFSVEAEEEQDFILRSTLRYAHSVTYLQKLAACNRLSVAAVEPQVIRREANSDVRGYVVVMTCS
jgi:predicted TPR repeat methyltransferase